MKVLSERLHRAITLELLTPNAEGMLTRADGSMEPLPKGVCGRVTGVALVYDQIDDYNTMFAKGCLDKTRMERVQPGKVKLFADHGPFTDTHVGTVRSLTDVGDGVVMVADIFDTEAGQRMKQYLEAVINSGSETGLSIGFRPIKRDWRSEDEGDSVLVYEEISLREISVTPVPAVPGTEVTGVRREAGETDRDLLLRTLARILKEIPEQEARAAVEAAYASSAAGSDTPAAPAPEPKPEGEAETPASKEGTADADGAESEGTSAGEGSEIATDEDRMAALRATYSD